jgi:transcriptional regulator with XRE-family HTH domain
MSHADYKAARERLGTQAQVAALLGVARSTVAHRESGNMIITKEAALAILALSPWPARKRRKSK